MGTQDLLEKTIMLGKWKAIGKEGRPTIRRIESIKESMAFVFKTLVGRCSGGHNFIGLAYIESNLIAHNIDS